MAVTGSYQFDLDGFTFGLGTTTSVVGLSGLDMPEIDLTVAPAGNRHGGSSAGRYLKERTLGLNGRINGTQATFPDLRDALIRAFRPRPTDDDVRFTFRLPGRTVNQFLLVKPQNIRGDWNAISTAVGMWDFNATMVAQDPRIYYDELRSVTLTPGAAAVTVNNPGNFEASVSISFNGVLSNPRVERTAGGVTQRFGLTAEIAAGQSYVADSLNNTILLAANSKYSSKSTTYRTWIELAPGDNTLTLVGTGTGNAVVSWRGTSI